MIYHKKWMITLTILFAFTLFFLGALRSPITSAHSVVSTQSTHTLSPLAGPPGCPNAFPLQSNTVQVDHDNQVSYLTATLYGWFTNQVSDTQGQKFVYCRQAYCTAELYGAFIAGTLTAYCNYGSGETSIRIGGTSSGQTNGYQFVSSGQITSQAGPGTYFWAVANYEPYDASTYQYTSSTNSFYQLPTYI